MLGLVSNQGTNKLSLLLLNLQEKQESHNLWCAQLKKGFLSFPSVVPGSPVQLQTQPHQMPQHQLVLMQGLKLLIFLHSMLHVLSFMFTPFEM